MEKIKVKHYTDTFIYSIEQTLKCFKLAAVQYFNSLNIGTTAEQFIVLDTIYCNDGICQRDLAKLMLKDKSNINRLINILEENKFTKRSIGRKQNRLVNQIFITPKGKKLIEDTMPQVKEFLLSLMEHISAKEIEQVHTLTEKFRKDLMNAVNFNI
ncbi:MAG: MarR family transcriptional regulator [Candidatus Gastranaerophilales bacterium]|nr:MarR family transcriptional regulator [Candidatus Gastranaerophilales bacterium]